MEINSASHVISALLHCGMQISMHNGHSHVVSRQILCNLTLAQTVILHVGFGWTPFRGPFILYPCIDRNMGGHCSMACATWTTFDTCAQLCQNNIPILECKWWSQSLLMVYKWSWKCGFCVMVLVHHCWHTCNWQTCAMQTCAMLHNTICSCQHIFVFDLGSQVRWGVASSLLNAPIKIVHFGYEPNHELVSRRVLFSWRLMCRNRHVHRS